MEASSIGGAFGNWPSTDWLPIITISRSSAMAPAARMTCSSSERVMDASALGGGEQGRERRGLAQARAFFGERCGACGDFRPGAREQRPPLGDRGGRALAVAFEPA